MTWKRSRTKKWPYDLFDVWTMRVGAFYLIVSDGGDSDDDVRTHERKRKRSIYIGVHIHADDHEIDAKYISAPWSRLGQYVERAKEIAEKMARKAGLAVPRR